MRFFTSTLAMRAGRRKDEEDACGTTGPAKAHSGRDGGEVSLADPAAQRLGVGRKPKEARHDLRVQV